MASIDIFWGDGAGIDIHLLAGEIGPSLLDQLWIKDDSNPPVWTLANTPPADIASIAFTPNFASAASPPENGGVKIDTANGKVTVAAAPTLTSFVVEAVVTTKPPNANTLGPIPIRVLVHKTIEEIWLTPGTLTIRDGSPGQKLTVLARFDDNTIGDITRRPIMTWNSSDAAKIEVGGADGTLTAHTHPVDDVTITVFHARHSATAHVKAKEPWTTPVAVKLLPGSAGVAKAGKVPNVLFLSEGFTDRGAFEDMTRMIVQRLSHPSLRPYDIVKGGVNFWSAFVPSREPGTSPLYDLNPHLADGTIYGFFVPDPVKPPGPTPLPPGTVGPPELPKYTLENLVYQVGLPTPADAGVNIADAKAKWVARYGAEIGERLKDDVDNVYGRWQALHNHRLANEVDSAFGLRNGERPTMHNADAPRVAFFNPRRSTRAHLNTFLKSLRLGSAAGPAIGAIWATKDPAVPIPDPTGAGLPAGLKTGQNSNLVFMLLGGAQYSGAQRPGLIVASLRHDTAARFAGVPGTHQVKFIPWELPSAAPLAVGALVAHETSHAFGLGDEYGEGNGPLRIPAAKEKDLTRLNVQAASAVERSPADPKLDPAKLGAIRWLWPRLDRAGVLAGEVVPNGANFDIRLARGHAAGFARNDRVRLRARPLVDHVKVTDRLQVTDVHGDVVTVKPLGAFTAGDWHAGSALIRPVRGPATAADPDGPDLPLIAPIISAHLAASGLPLDVAPPPAPLVACHFDDEPLVKPLNLPAGLPLDRPRWTAEIVGLYAAGESYFCGVYHSTGACLMRSVNILEGPTRTYLLCPVCRYILVDQFDPRLHRIIDRDYATRYPQP